MTAHTPEPWEAYSVLVRTKITAEDPAGWLLADCQATGSRSIENARRIVACVNACAGISTENLEQNRQLKEGLQGLNERIREAEQQRDVLLKALQSIQEYAHDHSTGPAVPDALWEVRRMAMEFV